MATLTSETKFDVAAASVCATLILCRCAYRLLFRCHRHATCHRRWRIDDTYMAFALLPLAGRTGTIVASFILNPKHDIGPSAAGMRAIVATHEDSWDDETSYKLILPARICYALFLWSLKLCLLSFYSRFVDPLTWGRAAIRTLWWGIVLSYAGVLIATLTECQPISHVWSYDANGNKYQCSKGLVNLILMASFNVVTDLALIVLPFPLLRLIRLENKEHYRKLQLIFLFGVGLIVVLITILRIPLILIDSVSQRSRSMWASIEILCACTVANTAFFYSLIKDLNGNHRRRTDAELSNPFAPATAAAGGNFYMQTLPSSSLRSNSVAAPSSILEAKTLSDAMEVPVVALPGGTRYEASFGGGQQLQLQPPQEQFEAGGAGDVELGKGRYGNKLRNNL